MLTKIKLQTLNPTEIGSLFLILSFNDTVIGIIHASGIIAEAQTTQAIMLNTKATVISVLSRFLVFVSECEKNAIKTTIALLKEGDPPEKIARCTELPLEKVLELQKQITEKA